MNIILALDKNYTGPAKVMLRSLATSNADYANVYILHSEIGLPEQERFTRECASFSDKQAIHFIEVDDSLFSHLPTAFGLPHTAYYRFVASDLLPDFVDRALYLDCDIIINHSIHEFYNTDFEDNLFVACEDIGVSVLGKYKFLTIFGRLGKELHNGKYFNSGVLLINMPLARQAINLGDVFEIYEKHPNDITFADQDILNFIYGGRTKYADYRIYNMGAGYVAPEDGGRVMENSAIIHYYGARDAKPWLDKDRSKSGSAVTRLWWSYAGFFEEYRSNPL
jgi:lipopolysaccharide biosynthesis glycosyltransferase